VKEKRKAIQGSLVQETRLLSEERKTRRNNDSEIKKKRGEYRGVAGSARKIHSHGDKASNGCMGPSRYTKRERELHIRTKKDTGWQKQGTSTRRKDLESALDDREQEIAQGTKIHDCAWAQEASGWQVKVDGKTRRS